MNSKKAKELRRKAREVTVGQPPVAYLKKDNGYTMKGGKRRGTIKVAPDCTRGAYLFYKRVTRTIRRRGVA